MDTKDLQAEAADLMFAAFDEAAALRLGNILVDLALADPVAIDVDMSVVGHPRCTVAPTVATGAHHQDEVAHVEIDRRDLLVVAREPHVRRTSAGERT